VYNRFGADIPADIWENVVLPDHLRTRVSIIDHDGRELRSGRDIHGLLKGHRGKSPDTASWNKLRSDWEKKGFSDWDFNDLPDKITMGSNITAYPGLEVDGDLVNIRIFPDGNQALESHLKGVRRLLAIRLAGDLKFLKRKWPFPREAAKGALYFGGESAVEKLMVNSIVKRLFQKNIRNRDDFKKYAQELTGEMLEKYRELREYSITLLKTYDHTRSRISDIEESNISNQAVKDMCADIRQEMEKLVPVDFPELYESERLVVLPRYLRAMEIRAERGSHNPDKDKIKADQIEEFIHILRDIEEKLSDNASSGKREGIEDFRWMVEEFKVSVFAPELGTAFPVSAKRLKKRAGELKRMV
jgi:ATP-dependent helicase HrpA